MIRTNHDDIFGVLSFSRIERRRGHIEKPEILHRGPCEHPGMLQGPPSQHKVGSLGSFRLDGDLGVTYLVAGVPSPLRVPEFNRSHRNNTRIYRKHSLPKQRAISRGSTQHHRYKDLAIRRGIRAEDQCVCSNLKNLQWWRGEMVYSRRSTRYRLAFGPPPSHHTLQGLAAICAGIKCG